MAVWRNWQTQRTQNASSERTCRFESDHRYYVIGVVDYV